jgi:peptide/nickel transport system substrate-binding protein
VPTDAPSSPPATGGGAFIVTRLSDFPTCFHPVCFQTGNQYMNFQLLYNSLVKVEADETTLIADLADTWKVSPDATTFTFSLNPNAKWHDGQPVTADDVIFTAAQAAQHADSYVGTYPITNWLVVKGADAVKGTTNIPEGIKKIDDVTVEFTLAAANAVWLRNLTDPAYMIMPKHLLEQFATGDAVKASDFVTGKATIGSGPYKMVKFTPDQAIEYTAHTEYHKGAPKIPQLIFVVNGNPDTAAAQLQNDELQMVFDLKPTDFDVLNGKEGLEVKQVPGVGQQSLQFPVSNPLVADKRVRQAIYYAFDRKTLLETAFNGAGKLLHIWLSFDENNPNLDKYEHDPEKAKKLIAEAEADGFDKSKELRIIYYPEEPGWNEIAAALENDLRAVGLNPKLDPSDSAGWTAKLPDPTTYEISLQCCGSNLYPDKASGFFNCKTPVGTFYANCDLDAKFVAARSTGDAAEQKKIYDEIAELLNEEVPYGWLWAVANTHANSTKVSGFSYYPNARESFSQIEKWTLAP